MGAAQALRSLFAHPATSSAFTRASRQSSPMCRVEYTVPDHKSD
jgi:hypothetical protein